MQAEESALFTARLSRHQSLSPRGRAIVLGLVSLVSLLVSLPFFLIGAWPVAGFLGLDVFLLWLAFRACSRNARAYEELAVTHVELLLRKVSPRGLVSEQRFNPAWVRLEAEEHAAAGVTRLALVEGRRRAEIGQCLNGEERAEFAAALKGALGEAKRGKDFS